MAELRRLSAMPVPDTTVDRDSRVEALLVEGLDRYFANRHEDAIHIWTRALFLDRSHARARAYIDRARTALAERQRRSEEMLQVSQHLLERGEAGAARTLLTQAVATTGDDERAAALRLKLERHERAQAVPPSNPPRGTPASDAVRGWVWSPWSPGVVVVAAALMASLFLVVSVRSAELRNWMGFNTANDSLAGSNKPARMPVLSSSDVALVRARTLYAQGRLAQALQALDRVAENSPVRQEADDLRVELQRLLLAGGPARSTPSQGASRDGR